MMSAPLSTAQRMPVAIWNNYGRKLTAAGAARTADWPFPQIGMHQMLPLILDLLDLTRVESGKVKRNITDVDLVQLARTAMDTMRPYAIQRDVTLTLCGVSPMIVQADSEEIEIIFNNLISNAIKYNKEGGSVTCDLQRTDDCIRIKVEDSGIGMSTAEIEKIFDDFVRIKNEKTKNISGSGLGLPIIKKLVDNYSGKIEVTSIPDAGSTFTVTLPI